MIMMMTPRRRTRFGALHISTAIAAILIAPGMAQAACTPNPVQADNPTTCSDTETTTLVVAADGAIVTVNAGALVSSSGESSIVVTSDPALLDSYTVTDSTITIDGTVRSEAGRAIFVTSDASSPYFYSNGTRSTITVGAAGVVTGVVGIELVAASSFYGLPVEVDLTSSGTIASLTGGYALLGDTDAQGRFTAVRNTATGVIGAISGQIGTLTNEGMIDGGSRSAFADAGGYLHYYSQGAVVNSGTIRAAGAAPTLFFHRGYTPDYFVENSGIITNEGTGNAIEGLTQVRVLNTASGTITSNATAIAAPDHVNVNNAGVITGANGAVVSNGQVILINRGTINGLVSGVTASVVDNVGGTINGNVALGDGDDLFIGDASNFGSPIGTINGTLNAGGGTDTLRFTFIEDTSLDTAIALPDTIERLALWIGNGKTLTLTESFAGTTPMAVGDGDLDLNTDNRFVQNGTITTMGTALETDPSLSGSVRIINNGSISATLSQPNDFAIDIYNPSQFTNSGTVIATNGGGLNIRYSIDVSSNSGAIIADQTAVRNYYSSFFTNEGVIRSNQSIGLDAQGGTFTNEGLIEGAVAGARVSFATLVNSGTISSGGSGVQIGYASQLDNSATGVINGGITPYFQPYGFVSNARISNAGTINGNVELGSESSYNESSNTFLALPGSIVNGNIHLGVGGDTFATALVNNGPGEFAGLTGSVTGSGQETLRYLVDTDATATLGLHGIFNALEYELSNNAKLVLTAPGTQAMSIGFFGQGSVDLTADLTSNGQGSILKMTGESILDVPDTVALVSRGTITVRPVDLYSASPAVIVGQGRSFTNAGTIIFENPDAIYYRPAAVQSEGGTAINDGIIRVAGAIGMSGVRQYGYTDTPSIINNGIITQIVGGTAAIGMRVGGSALNRGQIFTAGAGVDMSLGGLLINSGVITSTADVAIQSGFTSSASRVVNQEDGVISGGLGENAIVLFAGSQVSNAGTINGDVSLFVPFYDFGLGSTYVNMGGMLNGNLSFGSRDDIFVSLDGATGVTGTIDAREGLDIFVRSLSRSQGVDLIANGASLPAGFELQGVGAVGRDTSVTLTAASAITKPLLLIGDGTIINTASLSRVNLGSTFNQSNPPDIGWELSFINQGTIRGGLVGYARSFTNEGAVSGPLSFGSAVVLVAGAEQDFTFRNSGTITAPTALDPFYYQTRGVTISSRSDIAPLDSVDIGNSGTISGGLFADVRARRLTFVNSGLIDSNSINAGAVDLRLYQSDYYTPNGGFNPDSATITNSGTLADGLFANITARTLTFANSGTIQSYVGLYQHAHRIDDPAQGDYGAVDQESASITNSGTINGNLSLYAFTRAVDVNNSGTMALSISQDGDEIGDAALSLEVESLGDQTITFTNSGAITTNGRGGSAVIIGSYAQSAQDRVGEEGGDSPISTVKVVNSGTLKASGSPAFSPAFSYDDPYYGWDQPAYVQANAALGVGVLRGDVTIDNQGGGTIAATGMIGADENIPAGLAGLGGTALFVTADRLTLTNAGAITGIGGMVPGDIQFELDFADLPSEFRTLAGAIQTLGSADTVTNLATGTIDGSIDLGSGDDRLANFGAIRGAILLGTGDDSMAQNIGGVLTGVVDGGEGTDALTLDINGGGRIDQALIGRFVNFETQRISGTGTVTTDGPLSIDSLLLQDANLTLAAGNTLQTAGATTIVTAGGTNSIVNLGTIAGGVDLREGSNKLVNAGRIGGAVAFGAGDDELVLSGNPSFVGPIDGGGGKDRLVLATGGSDAAPLELNLSMVIGFEQTRQDGGTIALLGSYATGSFDIMAGRLLGRAGSILTAGTIRVAPGATFGSAGTVNGDLLVHGILSPGASPGTMTVNGDVTLATGSTALFEMTPTISDALVIDGKLTIATGTTLALVGTRPLTPGTGYKLITTSEGISGSFTTVSQAATIFGFLRQTDKSIDLLGQFQLAPGTGPQAMRTVDYLNGLLLAGTVTSGFIDAAPLLLTSSGFADPDAMARLNPESYASAGQIGVENGLAISAALRSANRTSAAGKAGPFTFGSVLGGWRRLPGSAATGTSRADISTRGALAGLGIASDIVSIGGYVGYIDARQRVGALDARTDADGMLAGIVGQATINGFSLMASVSYDASKADTTRGLPGGATARGRYKLRGWTSDISIGHAFGLGDGWTLQPEAGLTHIDTHRGGATESGGGALALVVDARRIRATFLNGGLTLKGTGDAAVRPWLSAGIRHQLSGKFSYASAALSGVATRFTVPGAARDATLATVDAGVAATVGNGITLSFGLGSEFGADSSGQHANLGLRLTF